MQEELLQFKLQKVWVPVDLPKGKRAIGSKWVFRNKKDERGIVIRNKVILVAHGHTQEEGIDYDEVFAPVAKIKAIRTIEEEVYVCEPLGFEDPTYPDKIYKVVKALYGLHQASRAWYETLANYLLENGFQRGKIDQSLSIKKQKRDILLVQVYVDNIIIGSTNKELYVKSASTPIETEEPLLKDPDGKDVDVHIYRSMIGLLMYLTSSRPDIMFAVCACVRFQVTLKVSHLYLVKRIFRYLKGKPHLGLWYPRYSPFNLVAYSDNDYARASLDRKSTTEGVNKSKCDEDSIELMELMVFMLQALIDVKKVVVTEDVIRQDLHLDDADGVECLPNEDFCRACTYGLWKSASQVNILQGVLLCTMKVLDTYTCLVCRKFNFFKVRKGFSRVETPLFASMIDPPQPQAAEVEEEVAMPTAPAPPSPTNAPSPIPQAPTPTPYTSPHASPTHHQPIEPSISSIPLLNSFLETYATLRMHPNRGKIEAIDVYKDITLVDIETQVDMDVKLQGRIDDDNAVTKDVNATEPTVFNDEEVTITMDQTLIKMKAEKAKAP
nr:putative ribonuclease H-like domain-containing protein [Tanacetum cinerariifolium]